MHEQDDLRALTQPDHWMGWLGDDPAQAVRDAVSEVLRAQVPTASLVWLRLHDEPHFLTGGRRSEQDENKIVVVRAALAVGFDLEVDDGQGSVEQLTGVFSWVAAGLDTADGRVDRTFFDLDMTLADGGEALQQRIYEIDAERPSQ